MKISIITPSYNQGIYIEDAINSVLAQDYADFEHIIIDAGSKDDTVNRLRKYPHLKWVSERDEGQSDGLNKGFLKATGDIICWLNADDLYQPGAFKKAAEILSDERIDGVYSNISFCDKDGRITGHLRTHRPWRFLSLFHIFVPSESFFFKRKIIDDKILLDKEFKIVMDKEWMTHILYKNYRLKYSNSTFGSFRKHELNNSFIQSRQKTIEEGIKIFNRYNGYFSVSPDRRMNRLLYQGALQCLKGFRIFMKATSF